MIYFLCLCFDVNLAFLGGFRSSLSVSGSWEGGGSNLVDLHGLVTQYIHTDLTETLLLLGWYRRGLQQMDLPASPFPPVQLA